MERREFFRHGVAAGVAVLGGAGCTAAPGTLARQSMIQPGGGGFGGTQATPAFALEQRLLKAQPLPLSSVRLTGGPLKNAQDLDAKYLLELEPDRMLAYYRKQAGLQPKAEGYGGWDGGGRNLTGHIAGHYLSAVSLMWLATGDERFKQRADYIVAQLKEVQDANKDGYLGALEGGREAFAAVSQGDIRSAGFDLNGLWAPWYTLHKTYAGLRDAYRCTGNRTALDVEVKFAGWAEGVLAPLSEEQVQRMLRTEFGGMNEVLVDLYADTGDRRWLELSYKFEDRSLLEPLQRHQDVLGGKHGNTQIPKLIGSMDRYLYTGTAADLMASSFFWDRVVQHHTFATGGHGKDEYFGPPDQLSERVDGRTAETCNVYNMLKLTRRLFAARPDAHYFDFAERALYNHILGSIDPNDGATSYMVPVGRAVRREYANMFESFTCCVGSGMESHALHGDGVYYHAGDQLWVNLYAPSTAHWEEKGVQVAMETGFPEGETATLRLHLREPNAFTLSLRRPYWAGDGFTVSVNGQPVALPSPEPPAQSGRPQAVRPGAQHPSVYVDLERDWKSGDVVTVSLPKSLRLEPLPDNPRRVAIMWGPLALAGDLGPEPPRGRGEQASSAPRPQSPVFVAAEKPVESWVQPVPGEPGKFRTVGVGREPNAEGRPKDMELVPFYRLHRRIYSSYWDLFTPEEWEQQRTVYAAEHERLRKLEAATVAYVQPGEMQPERDFNYQASDNIQVWRMMERPGRSGRGWFSFDVPVEPSRPMALVVTYYTDDRRGMPAAFDVLVDGQKIGERTFERTEPGNFFDVEFPIPAELVRGKQKVTVRFEAKDGRAIPVTFGVRMIRADAPR